MGSKKIGRIFVPGPDTIDVEDIRVVDPTPVKKTETTVFKKDSNKEQDDLADKYEITNIPAKIGTTQIFVGYRIRALRDINKDVKKGQLGGAVQRKDNLSQKGSCWIYPGAIAAGHSVVKDNAILSEGAVIYDRAVVSGNAKVVGEEAMIGGTAHVYGNAMVSESFVEGTSEIFGNAIVECHSHVFDDAKVYGDAIVHHACVSDAKIHGNCIVDQDVWSGDHTIRPASEDLSW